MTKPTQVHDRLAPRAPLAAALALLLGCATARAAVDPPAARPAPAAPPAAVAADGVDVAPGPAWTVVPASALSACVTTAPDGTRRVRVTRACACGETLSCVLTAGFAGVRVEVRVDPDSRGVCTECYAVSTACTLPAGVPTEVSVNGAPARALPACAP